MLPLLLNRPLVFLFLTETWYKPLDSHNQTTPTGFTCIDKPCLEGEVMLLLFTESIVKPPTFTFLLPLPPKPFLSLWPSYVPSPSVLLLSDFNIQWWIPAIELLELLQCFNFTQHITFPNHSCGNILDLVCLSSLTSMVLEYINSPVSFSLTI